VAIESNHDVREENDIMWADMFMDIYLAITPFRARFLPPIFLLCFGVFLASIGELSSTYICSAERTLVYSVAVSQGIGVVLDCILIIGTWRLFSDSNGERRKLGIFSAIALYSAALLSLLSIPSLLYSSVSLIRVPSLAVASMWPTLEDGTTLAIALLCFIYLISEIRTLVLIVVFVFAWLYTPLIQAAWSSFSPFPPRSKGAEVIGLLIIFMGFTTFMHISSSSERSSSSRNFAKRIPVWFYVLLTIFFLVAEGFYLLKPAVAGFHPINILMYNARIEGDRWRVLASSSISLETAVAEYRSRYRGRAPPPNFDKWYEFARERGCPVIDNYDQIDRDLLPFWAVPPSLIRERSPLQLPSNDIFAIRIRDGHVEVSPFSYPDRKWRPDETVNIIEKFAQWLPDMYIAFNLRDVPRVTMPWKQIDDLKKRASTIDGTLKAGKDHGFTPNLRLNSNWPSIENDYATSDTYKEFVRRTQQSPDLHSFPSIFQKREGPTCPPNSPTGRSKAWHAPGFCAACAYTHSLGQFLHNWTLAGDLCHQPDMANLHGFLMSPGTVPDVGYPEGQLVPVFSRSKVPGYNDILFPAPGDYVDLTEPRPNEKIFSEMSNTLLWRGPAEDDMSAPRTWRGKTPERLAHLTNKSNSTKLIPMLLPAKDPEKFVYENVPATELAGLLDLDVGITECEQCSTKEYLEQKRELGTKPSINENEFFNYRYLFVPDVRGASRRFVSFLRSNAVPFRSSIFRSWYDDRLTPWLHYVPIDGRLQAVHSTLAYFAGLKGKINGRDIDMPQKFGEASFIANQGTKWAEKALRREDAEAYLFRLLLEYGRVVDDRRNDIGFQLEE
jgi:Glycosyl transferase family 90